MKISEWFIKSYVILMLTVPINSVCSAQPFSVRVWPGGAPDSNGMSLPEEVFDGVRVRNVSEAEMIVFLPDKKISNGAAVVICPGGGYQMLAMDHEGYDMAKWLSGHGIAGIILKYRLPYGHHTIPSSDARRAIRTVRANAAAWGIDPGRVGLAGSSAGGHLASTVGTRFDGGDPNAFDPIERFSCRPDFLLLLYPVITMKEEFGHMGSRRNLIGDDGSAELAEFYSNEMHVGSDTPPAFLVLADDDKAVVPRNSVEFYLALKKNDVKAEMHIFQNGGHGFGMRQNNIPADNWPELFIDWLKSQAIIR
jgi:acetyl esterase/lipase